MAKWIATVLFIGFAMFEIVECACDAGWGQHSGACYYVSSAATHSWHAAKNWCITEGGDLASILSNEESNYVAELVGNGTSSSNLWIGLNQLSDRIMLEWSDDSNLSYTHWQNGHPLNDQLNLCTSIISSVFDCPWQSDNCGRLTGFVCKKPENATGLVTPPPTAAVPGYCPTGYFGTDNKCFRVFRPVDGQTVNWTTALDICRSQPGLMPDLASINSKEEQDIVLAQLRDVEAGMWLGLMVWGGGSSSTPWLWADNSDVTFTNWQRGKPEDGNENCAEFLTWEAGTWSNAPCSQPRGYVCQTFKDSDAVITTPQPTPFPCPAGYTAYWYGCYRFVYTSVTWSDAEQSCRSDGGHLVSILSAPENAAMVLYADGQLPAWTGLANNSNSAKFTWSDGSAVYYTKWMNREPSNGECVIMTTSDTWDAVLCSEMHGYICEITTELQPTPPADVKGVCPDDRWIAWGTHCYYFTNYTYSTYTHGEEECRVVAGNRFYGTLTSIHSEAENRFIYETFIARGLDTVDSFIGLRQISGEQQFVWQDDTIIDYTRWAVGEPNFEPNHLRQCGFMHLRDWPGHWGDYECSHTHDDWRAVCKTPQALDPLVHCPSGEWHVYNISGTYYCYLFRANTAVNFTMAQQTCVAEGGNLTSIHSSHENWIILYALQEMEYYGTSYIGLTKLHTDDPLEWVDGTPVDYEIWYFGHPQPGLYCVDQAHYSTDAAWTSTSCGELQSYVCKAGLSYSV